MEASALAVAARSPRTIPAKADKTPGEAARTLVRRQGCAATDGGGHSIGRWRIRRDSFGGDASVRPGP